MRVWVHTDQQIIGTATVPSGATTKQFEPRETRDEDPKRYYGEGMKKAIENIQGPILRAYSLRPKTPFFWVKGSFDRLKAPIFSLW